MPSSHVAEAVVIMVYALRAYGKRAVFLIPIVIFLAAGTVYGRFHYLTDVIMGISLAIITLTIAMMLYPNKKPEYYAPAENDSKVPITNLETD